MLRGVLFDLDGTLVHTSIDFPAMRAAVLGIVADAGVSILPYQNRDALGVVHDVARRLGAEGQRFYARCEAAMVACELAALEDARPMFGAIATLGWLRGRGIRVGIVTRNSRVAVERLLAVVPLPHDVLLTRNDVALPKPDPSHLQIALERLRVAAWDAVMVGDHVLDVVAGRAAGMRALVIAHGPVDEGKFSECPPDQVLTSFEELRLLVPEL